MENYTSVKGFGEALGNSIVISLTSAVISMVLVFFLTYSIQYANLDAKSKKLIRLLAVLPMLLPTKIKELQYYTKFNEVFVLSRFILGTNLIVKEFWGM